MSFRNLKFEEIKRRAEKFREIAQSYSLNQEFHLDPEVEKFLRENSLAPIIATICDQQIKAEDAWTFPYWLSNQLDVDFSAENIYNLGKKKIKDLLRTFMKGKWPSRMSEKDRERYLEKISGYIMEACRIIKDDYFNNPDNMFKFNNGKFTVPELYFILRAIPGIGPKKASMIVRDFAEAEEPWYKGVKERLKEKGIELKIEGKYLSDVPVDVHVAKVFGRILGLFKNTPSRNRFLYYWPDIQNFAKVVFPDFPGRLDYVLWIVGREYCHEHQPNCNECPLKDIPCEYARRI